MKNVEYVGSLWEEWKPIPGYEGLYEVSNEGRVRSLNYHREGEVKGLKAGKARGDYLRVQLYKDGKGKNRPVHRLVYEAFNGPIPPGMQINHLDEVKTNNWLGNLEVCTPSENVNYGTRNERIAKARTNHPSLSKAVHQIDKLTGEVINTFPSAREAERQTGINQSHIVQCCKGNSNYSHAGGFIWQYA